MKIKLLCATSFLLVVPTSVFSQAETGGSVPPALESGDPAAVYEQARAILRGEGVPKNPEKAFELMKSAADRGNAEALGGLGYFYSVGLVVPKDEKLAAEWFRKGANKGSAKSQLNLGRILVGVKDQPPGNDEKDIEEGIQWIKKAADQGLAEAAYSYGLILFYGEHGVAEDLKSATHFLGIAGDHGFADAQNILGVIAEKGKGMPKDVATARAWFRKAALQGNGRAQFNLGRLLGPFDQNKSVRIEAMAWMLLAEKQRDIVAIKTLEDYRLRLNKEELAEAMEKSEEFSKLVNY